MAAGPSRQARRMLERAQRILSFDIRLKTGRVQSWVNAVCRSSPSARWQPTGLAINHESPCKQEEGLGCPCNVMVSNVRDYGCNGRAFPAHDPSGPDFLAVVPEELGGSTRTSSGILRQSIRRLLVRRNSSRRRLVHSQDGDEERSRVDHPSPARNSDVDLAPDHLTASVTGITHSSRLGRARKFKRELTPFR